MGSSSSAAVDRSAFLRLVDAPREQTVEFYESEHFLIDTVTSFVGQGLERGETTVVIATRPHRKAFELSLDSTGVDLALATGSGRYVALDATKTLSRFMVDGRAHRGRFRDTLGGVIERAAQSGRSVRIYSEMVSLLWSEHNVAATIALGELWRSLKLGHDFKLLCAYPMRAFADEDSNALFEQICSQHSSVIPSDPFPFAGDRAEQQRAVAELQREVVELRATLSRERAEQDRLAEVAHVDVLTGLGNRRAFDSHLQREWELARRRPYDSQLLLVDLDNFKELNDTHGHAAGDEVLRRFGRTLAAAARSTDIVCRLGGDEFGVILVNCRPVTRAAFVRRVEAALARSQETPAVRASIGHASLRPSDSAADALKDADRGMYRAKRRRRGQRSRRGGLLRLRASAGGQS